MKVSGALRLLAAAVIVLWSGLTSASTAPTPTVRATLIGFEETPAISTAASGSFVARLGDSLLEYELSYDGLEAPVLFAHIHFGQRGVAGGISAFLCSNAPSPPTPPGTPHCPTPSGTVTGTITAANVIGPTGQGIATGDFGALARAILNGIAYANVHSTRFPTGEIRGQIRGKHFPDTDP